jgi:hypothetical protein
LLEQVLVEFDRLTIVLRGKRLLSLNIRREGLSNGRSTDTRGRSSLLAGHG